MDVPQADVPVLAIQHLSKSFGGTRALDDVHLTVQPGEVHGLLGQNGSGKSTLIKVLAGYHAPDGGEIKVHGDAVKLPLHPGEFRKLGISFVHQDLGLIPSLSVLENLCVGELAAGHRWHISWADERRKARATLAQYGVQLDPAAKVADLPQTDRALLAIVRAVADMRRHQAAEHAGRGLLVLDEPTAFLPRAGVEQLFALVRDIAVTGASVLFVSHDLDEVLEITDRMTVLRDGRVVGTLPTAAATERQLVEMIIGRTFEALVAHATDRTAKQVHMAIVGLSGGTLRDISIDVHEGEIVGLTGLIGSGFEEVPYLVFGAARARCGTLILGGRSYDLTTMTPAQAVQHGIALLPADRQHAGSVGSLTVADNVTLQVLHHYITNLVLNRRRMVREAQTLLGEYDVRPNDPTMTFQALSGGNQQKVLLAKWLCTTPALLLLHEATQGVDVGARQQIYTLIVQAARKGTAVLCASSDYEQLATICDRVLIFGRGRIMQELVGKEITKERIAEQCYNSVTTSALTGSMREGA